MICKVYLLLLLPIIFNDEYGCGIEPNQTTLSREPPLAEGWAVGDISDPMTSCHVSGVTTYVVDVPKWLNLIIYLDLSHQMHVIYGYAV